MSQRGSGNSTSEYTICFDIDGVICKTEGLNYLKSKPIKKNIKKNIEKNIEN